MILFPIEPLTALLKAMYWKVLLTFIHSFNTLDERQGWHIPVHTLCMDASVLDIYIKENF